MAGTGSFTIPLMTKNGISKKYAAAIEAGASSGGQIMPPIMGAAAFLMCDFLSESYVKIIIRAFIPALLFYLVTAFAIYMTTKNSIAPLVEDTAAGAERFKLRRSEFYSFLLPIAISIGTLFFLLGYLQWSISRSAYWAIAALLTICFVVSFALEGSRGVRGFFEKLGIGIRSTLKTVVPIGVALACVGIMVRALTVTGLSQKLSFFMVDMAGGSLPMLLLLIGAISIIFGMAVATSAAYVLVVILPAPALESLGVDLPVAHFMVFYLAMLSAITPPIGAAVIVGSGIARSPYLKTAFITMGICISLFLLPFTFVTYPELVDGSSKSIIAGLVAGVGLTGIAYAFNYRNWSIAGIVYRGLCLFAGAVILLRIGTIWTGISMGLVLLLVSANIFKGTVNSGSTVGGLE